MSVISCQKIKYVVVGFHAYVDHENAEFFGLPSDEQIVPKKVAIAAVKAKAQELGIGVGSFSYQTEQDIKYWYLGFKEYASIEVDNSNNRSAWAIVEPYGASLNQYFKLGDTQGDSVIFKSSRPKGAIVEFCKKM